MNRLKQLTSLGLTENQAEMYLALLVLGRATVLQLSRKIEIQRPTIYENVAKLEAMGLVSKVVERGKVFFEAGHPRVIHELLTRKQKEAALLIPELEAMLGPLVQQPEMKFFRGIEGLKRLAEIIPHSNGKEIRTIGSFRYPKSEIRGIL